MMRYVWLTLTLLAFATTGCEDPAKRVKSDPNDRPQSEQHEQGSIATH